MKLFDKVKVFFMGEEDYTLKTFQDTDEKIRQNARRKFAKYLIIFSLGLPAAYVIAKSTFRYIDYHYISKPNIEKVEEVKKIKNTDMKVSDEHIWRTKSEIEQKKLKKDLENVKKTLGDLNVTIVESNNEIKEQIVSQNKLFAKNQDELKDIVKQQAEDTNNKLKNVKDEYKKDISNVKKEISEDAKTKLTKLDPNKLIPINKVIGKQTMDMPEVKEAPIEKVEFIEIDDSIQETKVSTLNNFDDEKKKVKPKTFILDAGFGKVTILGAGQFNTIDQAKDERIPVFFSIDTDILTANGDSIDLKGCNLRGTGQGDFGSGRVPVSITHLDCKLTDKDGNKYRISEDIKGVVYDETGGYALKGRLITKEGEVFAKALPLTFLETAMNILTNKAENNNDSTGDVLNIGQATAQGASTTGQTIINKMGEYWLKYLDSLNPKIDVRPGRQVVVALFGGEVLNIKKYIPADLENFEKGLLDTVNIEDQTTMTKNDKLEKERKINIVRNGK